jgi:acetyl esterase/lipase
MGALPHRSQLGPLEVREHERLEGDGYTRLTISFLAEVGDRVPAYLYLPASPASGQDGGVEPKRPAMLALHQTSPWAKGEVAGEGTTPNQAYGLELARRGYVVLAPDYPSFGDYPYDFALDRYASGSMKGVFNHMRAVDLLTSRPEVDPERIGAIGHSLGGHNAMFAGVFDERLKVVVSSCGWTPFHDYYSGKIEGWTSSRYMPWLRDVYGLDPDRAPFDFYELVGALAPRAFFSSSPTADSNFDVAGVRKAVAEAQKVYDLLGASKQLQLRTPEAEHDFPLNVRAEAYAFIDSVLGQVPLRAAAEPPALTPDRRLWAGAASVDITPPLGFRLSGYFHERISTGVHDPLRAKALYLRQDREAVAFVLCDLIGISLDVSQEARRLAGARLGVASDRIVVGATHCHTGPLYFGALREHLHEKALREHGSDPHEKLDYAAELVSRLVEVASRARDLAAPVELAAARTREGHLSFNRRFHMMDGTVRFNPGKLNPEIVRAAGPIDPDLDVVFWRAGAGQQPFGALTVFALHLDTVGGTEYSGDFPRHLESSLRERFGGRFQSLFGAGACGDLNHIDVSEERPQKGHGEAQRIGEAIAQRTIEALADARPVAARLAARSAVVRAPLQRFSSLDLEQARRDLDKLGSPELPFLDQVRAYRIVSLALRGGNAIAMEVQAFRLGDDLAVVTLPGEVFVELGLAIKQVSPFRQTIVVELANDAPGYIPTRKAFIEGSYEVVNSRVEHGGGELLVDAALRLLRDLKALP